MLPVVAAMLVNAVRCGTDIPSMYSESFALRMPLIQWQSPRIVSWLAHCLKSTANDAASAGAPCGNAPVPYHTTRPATPATSVTRKLPPTAADRPPPTDLVFV